VNGVTLISAITASSARKVGVMHVRRAGARKGSAPRRRNARAVRVYVARHGETTWNAAGRYQGRLESELSALGMRQAEALASAMRGAHLRRVISSPLRAQTEGQAL
jgi:hypothetical protein